MIKLYNADKPSMPEQVQINKLNIDELKKNIEANAIYNANTAIDTSATAITTDDVKNWDDSITNGYILDTIGNLFKIVAVESGNIYIDYACTLPSGIGITSIVAGVPTTVGNTTTTPLTITYSNGTTTTINITAQRGATGATGATGNGIAQIRSFVPTVEDGKTITPLEIEFTNGTTQTIYVQATNGADGQDGADGQNGTNGTDGVGISGIAAGAPTVSGNTTITPLTITFTNGTTTGVSVVATNGADGQNGASVTNVTFALKTGTTDTYVATTTLSNGTTVNSGDIVLPSGGGSTLFQHNITLYEYDNDNGIYNFYIIINIISASSTPYTRSTIMNLLQSRSNSSASGDNLVCNGCVQFYDSNTQTVSGYITQYLAANSNSGLVFLYYFDGTSLNSYTTFDDLTNFYVDDNVKTL